MKVAGKIALILMALACLSAARVSALTLDTRFMGGTPPANAAGGGNLTDIVNSAARIWEKAYPDPITITLYFGWAPVGDAATHTLLHQGGTPNRELAGIILFDNSGAVSFYLDPTPDASEEYQHQNYRYQDLGGGPVNVARLFSSPTGMAVGRVDLLTVALHEIGHALGMCAANATFVEEARQGVLRIVNEPAFAGTVIPLASNRAGITSHFDALKISYGALMAGICSDERRLPSTLDMLADAQVSGLTMAADDSPVSAPHRVLPSRYSVRDGNTSPPQRK